MTPSRSKKNSSKVDPKTVPSTAPATKAAGEVEVYHAKQGWRWRIVDAADKTIAMPPASAHWATKEEALQALAAVKALIGQTPVEAKAKE